MGRFGRWGARLSLVVIGACLASAALSISAGAQPGEPVAVEALAVEWGALVDGRRQDRIDIVLRPAIPGDGPLNATVDGVAVTVLDTRSVTGGTAVTLTVDALPAAPVGLVLTLPDGTSETVDLPEGSAFGPDARIDIVIPDPLLPTTVPDLVALADGTPAAALIERAAAFGGRDGALIALGFAQAAHAAGHPDQALGLAAWAATQTDDPAVWAGLADRVRDRRVAPLSLLTAVEAGLSTAVETALAAYAGTESRLRADLDAAEARLQDLIDAFNAQQAALIERARTEGETPAVAEMAAELDRLDAQIDAAEDDLYRPLQTADRPADRHSVALADLRLDLAARRTDPAVALTDANAAWAALEALATQTLRPQPLPHAAFARVNLRLAEAAQRRAVAIAEDPAFQEARAARSAYEAEAETRTAAIEAARAEVDTALAAIETDPTVVAADTAFADREAEYAAADAAYREQVAALDAAEAEVRRLEREAEAAATAGERAQLLGRAQAAMDRRNALVDPVNEAVGRVNAAAAAANDAADRANAARRAAEEDILLPFNRQVDAFNAWAEEQGDIIEDIFPPLEGPRLDAWFDRDQFLALAEAAAIDAVNTDPTDGDAQTLYETVRAGLPPPPLFPGDPDAGGSAEDPLWPSLYERRPQCGRIDFNCGSCFGLAVLGCSFGEMDARSLCEAGEPHTAFIAGRPTGPGGMIGRCGGLLPIDPDSPLWREGEAGLVYETPAETEARERLMREMTAALAPLFDGTGDPDRIRERLRDTVRAASGTTPSADLMNSLLDLAADRDRIGDLDPITDALRQIGAVAADGPTDAATAAVAKWLQAAIHLYRASEGEEVPLSELEDFTNLTKYGVQFLNDARHPNPLTQPDSPLLDGITYLHGAAALAEGTRDRDATVIMDGLRDTLGQVVQNSPRNAPIAAVIDIPGEVAGAMINTTREGWEFAGDAMNGVADAIGGDPSGLDRAIAASNRIEETLSPRTYGRRMLTALRNRTVDRIPIVRSIFAYFVD